MRIQDGPEWELGEIAVQAVREWLLAQGFYLLATDRIDFGGAPAFIGSDGRITVPDILAAHRTVPLRWHEVKWKSYCVKYQVANTWRHGIDEHLWPQYLHVQEVTSIPGWLTIVQHRPGPEAQPDPLLLTAPFDWLAMCAQGHNGGGERKVWWKVDDFVEQYPITVGEGWRNVRIGPRVVHPWEQKSKKGVAPRWNPPGGQGQLDL